MKNRYSLLVIIIISLSVGLLHFIIGPNYDGIVPEFVTGYLMDILLPMNMYLLFQVSFRKKTSVVSSRIFAAVFTVLFSFWVEFLQWKGFSLLGNTYDRIDLLMYILGVVMGIIIDLWIIERFEKNA